MEGMLVAGGVVRVVTHQYNRDSLWKQDNETVQLTPGLLRTLEYV